jgi:hypothetical protein
MRGERESEFKVWLFRGQMKEREERSAAAEFIKRGDGGERS